MPPFYLMYSYGCCLFVCLFVLVLFLLFFIYSFHVVSLLPQQFLYWKSEVLDYFIVFCDAWSLYCHVIKSSYFQFINWAGCRSLFIWAFEILLQTNPSLSHFISPCFSDLKLRTQGNLNRRNARIKIFFSILSLVPSAYHYYCFLIKWWIFFSQRTLASFVRQDAWYSLTEVFLF